MIISVVLENWMSFKERTEFSMVASRERQHGARVPRVSKYQTRILPVAALYGGNASGKTNFCKALSFAQRLVTRGSTLNELIPVEPFKLDKEYRHHPTSMTFTLLIDELIYEFSFVITRNKVLQERLVIITSTSERVLYDRNKDNITFHDSLKSDDHLKFAFKGTRENQLFLTNTVLQQVKTFKPIYDWFDKSLVIISPDARFQPFDMLTDEDNPLHLNATEALHLFDTGIAGIGSETVSLETQGLDKEDLDRLNRDIAEDAALMMMHTLSGKRLIVSRVDDELVAKKMITYHVDNKGKRVKFDLDHESDGSRRLIDLLPAFWMLTQPSRSIVIVVDELDRSLHHLLTRQLMEMYLKTATTDSRSQLLFTTHDLLVMDQDLLRRDEMWVAERDFDGVTSLIAFSDYKEIRYDKDIRKSYLEGRLGGIPRISKAAQMRVSEAVDKKEDYNGTV